MFRSHRSWLCTLALVVACTACSGTGNDHISQSASLMATQPVVFIPGAIDYTGTRDVTNALQLFINRIGDGRVLKFHRDGRYRVEGTLVVTNRSLTFDGQNATIFATSRGTLRRSQWQINGGTGIVFRNLNVRGGNQHAGIGDRAYDPKREKQHGFHVEGVQGLELDHVTVTDIYGDFVYLARNLALVPSANVWIHDSTFSRNGRQGIAIVCAAGVIIERNTFGDTRRATIDLEPNGPNQSVTNVHILDNTVGRGRLLFIAAHGRGPVNSVVISGNRLYGHTMTIDEMPLAGQRRQNWIVTNNTSDMSAHARQMRFFATDGILIAGNTQRVTDGQPGVVFSDVCGAQIDNNDFGTGGFVLNGVECSAPLDIPLLPVILGRL